MSSKPCYINIQLSSSALDWYISHPSIRSAINPNNKLTNITTKASVSVSYGLHIRRAPVTVFQIVLGRVGGIFEVYERSGVSVSGVNIKLTGRLKRFVGISVRDMKKCSGKLGKGGKRGRRSTLYFASPKLRQVGDAACTRLRRKNPSGSGRRM